MSEQNKITPIESGSVFPYYGELGTINLDSLSSERYGVYRQSKSGNIYSGLNYPVDSPGALLVLPSWDKGCTQEYRPYDSTMLYRRRYYILSFIWLWSDWCQEYNSENRPSPDDMGALGRIDSPAGVPVLWPSTTPPEGWLVCDGLSFSSASCPLLSAVFPSGKLPSLSAVADLTSEEFSYIVRAI